MFLIFLIINLDVKIISFALFLYNNNYYYYYYYYYYY